MLLLESVDLACAKVFCSCRILSSHMGTHDAFRSGIDVPGEQPSCLKCIETFELERRSHAGRTVRVKDFASRTVELSDQAACRMMGVEDNTCVESQPQGGITIIWRSLVSVVCGLRCQCQELDLLDEAEYGPSFIHTYAHGAS